MLPTRSQEPTTAVPVNVRAIYAGYSDEEGKPTILLESDMLGGTVMLAFDAEDAAQILDGIGKAAMSRR